VENDGRRMEILKALLVSGEESHPPEVFGASPAESFKAKKKGGL